MLIKLLPDQITRFWETIEFCLKETFPTYREKEINNLLESMLSQKMTCWLVVEQKEEKRYPEGIILTCFGNDLNGSKNMIIYMLYIFAESDKVPFDIWVEGFETLVKFARSRKCNSIVAFSNVDSVIKKAKMLSNVITQTFICFQL